MVTTKKDGTKVKEYLDPDDPRISEIGITRKLKPSSLLGVADKPHIYLHPIFGNALENTLGDKW